jgi:hypothetical protein
MSHTNMYQIEFGFGILSAVTIVEILGILKPESLLKSFHGMNLLNWIFLSYYI